MLPQAGTAPRAAGEGPVLPPELTVVPTAGRRSNLMTISVCFDYILETFSVGKQHKGMKTTLESGLDSSCSRTAVGRPETSCPWAACS